MPGALKTKVTEETVIADLLTDLWQADLADHIIRAEWSPDGAMLAAAAISGPVTIFNADGKMLHRLAGHAHGTQSISWSADSRFLATSGQDGAARVWDAMTGGLCHTLDAGASWVDHVAFSPMKDYLLTSAGRLLRLWGGTGELLREFPKPISTITDLAWQEEDLFFVIAAYGQVSMYNAEDSKYAKTFGWKGSILVVTWSPDSNCIATGNQDATVHFWYRKTGKDLEMSGYPSKIRELAWDPSSRYLATGGSATVMIWDCGGKGPSGSRPIQLEAHDRILSSLMFDPKGVFLASGCHGGRVYVWNHKRLPDRPLRGSDIGSAVTQIRWTRDGARIAAASADGVLRVFSRPEKEL